MKLRLLLSSVLFVLLGLTTGAHAQDSSNKLAAAQAGHGKDKGKDADKGAPKTDNGDRSKPERPGKEDKQKEAVENIKSDFRAKADDFVKKQRELLNDLKNAKSEDKDKVREKLKDLKEKWKDDQQEVRDRVANDLKEKVDQEKEKGNGGRPRK
jgi:hypothetical protein